MPTHRVVKIDELSQYFHLPEKAVAKQLGVCLTSLKKICRQNGITRWPYRKLKSLDKKIHKIENALTSSAEDPSSLLVKWEVLKMEKQNLPFAGHASSDDSSHSDAETKKHRSPVANTFGSERCSTSASATHSSASSTFASAASTPTPVSGNLHTLLESKLRAVGGIAAHRHAMANNQSSASAPRPTVAAAPVAPPRPDALDMLDDDMATMPVDVMMSDDERARLVDMYCRPLDSARSARSLRLADVLSPANANVDEGDFSFGDFTFSADELPQQVCSELFTDEGTLVC